MSLEMTIMLGLPGSGKSSHVSKNYEGLGGVNVICFDIIRRAFGHVYHRSTEPAVEFFGCTMARIALLAGNNVVIDESITDPSLASDLRDIAKEYGAKLTMVYVDMPVQHCREKRVPHGFPEADFDRKVTEWGAHGREILNMADVLLHIKPVEQAVGGGVNGN